MRLQTLSAARWILAFFALLAVAAVFLSVWLSLLFVLLFFFTVAFFRDPERAVPADPNLIVAAADGTVIYRQHQGGLCLDARRPDCSEKNESMTWAFENPRVTIVVRQITGAIARRIVAWSQIGDELKKGDRFGMIRFGSRTELYLPLNAEVLVKVGDHVLGGSTVIARLPKSVAQIENRANVKSASPLREGERSEVRGFTTYSQQRNPHPTLSLEKGEATEDATGM